MTSFHAAITADCSSAPDLRTQKVNSTLVAAKRSLRANITALYVIQVLNYSLPLFTIPYLLRTLGPTAFGAFSFAASAIAYATLLVNYGFDYSGTRNIAVLNSNMGRLSEMAMSIWMAKSILMVVALAMLGGAALWIPKLRDVMTMLAVLSGVVLGNVLVPTWLFQGLQNMPRLASVKVYSRIVSSIGIFVLVRRPSDALKYGALLAGESVLAGLLALITARSLFGIRFTMPPFSDVVVRLRTGAPLFLSTVSATLFTSANTLLLGFLAGHSAVGYYSAAEKLVLSLGGLFGPIAQASYPRMAELAAKNKAQALKLARHLMVWMALPGMGLALAMILLAPILVPLIFGPLFGQSVRVVQVLAPYIAINAVTSIWGVQIMLSFGRDKAFMTILISAGVFNISAALMLVPRFQQNGMAAAALLSGLVVTIAQAVYLRRQRLLP